MCMHHFDDYTVTYLHKQRISVTTAISISKKKIETYLMKWHADLAYSFIMHIYSNEGNGIPQVGN